MAHGCLGSYGGDAVTECPDAGAQPSLSSAMSGTVFYSNVDKRAANKKSYVGVRRKEKRGEEGEGRKLHTADLIIRKVWVEKLLWLQILFLQLKI